MFFPSNQIGKSLSIDFWLFAMMHHLPFHLCDTVFQEDYFAVSHQLVHHRNPFLQIALRQNIRHIFDMAKHPAGF